MPDLIIDNKKIQVAKGTRVIDAAQSAGIYIPRFCYFAELGAVGACRVCAVKFIDGPVEGIEMSCMVEAEDGMVVSTDDAEAVDFRRHVIEWMMMNHPHDCPVCDEGGHCLLQDLTVAGGHGIRRFSGKKRTYADQYLGPLISHEENRCIQCYRCSRFYQEYCGYKDLGVMGIAQRIYFGRYKDGVLENPFSGNLIDICPTGVYTDKPSRYTGRKWDFEQSSGVCTTCSLGCSIRVSARYRQVVRLEAGYSQAVNGAFICDRGRYGFSWVNSEKRPRQGRVDKKTMAPQKAAAAAAGRINDLEKQYGPGAIAVAGSGRSSLEALAAWHHLCQIRSWRGFFFDDLAAGPGAAAAVSGLSRENAVSMKAVESADMILAVGADPLREAPMLALAMRQAWRAGAGVFAIDPRDLEWPFAFRQVSAAADEIPGLVSGMATGNGFFENDSRHGRNMAAIRDQLAQSRSPVIVCGTAAGGQATVSAAAGLVQWLRKSKKDARLFGILPMANTFGGILLNGKPGTPEELIKGMESGQIKALVAAQSDLWKTCQDPDRLDRALRRLEFLCAADCVATELVSRADIVIPVFSVFEAGGIYINQEARAQWSQPAHAGGTPVRITGAGGHPPRVIGAAIPGGGLPPAWLAAWQIAGLAPPDSHEAMMDWMTKAYPVTAPVKTMGSEGVRIFPSQ
ncbi:MAG: NADH-quinone oxidoreductase subunit NuoG [Desulfobacterales bacterium]|nr:NADH-quinone oxidoreductase subunit NuoG [Desulfobacterales bacterium]